MARPSYSLKPSTSTSRTPVSSGSPLPSSNRASRCPPRKRPMESPDGLGTDGATNSAWLRFPARQRVVIVSPRAISKKPKIVASARKEQSAKGYAFRKSFAALFQRHLPPNLARRSGESNGVHSYQLEKLSDEAVPDEREGIPGYGIFCFNFLHFPR